MSPTRTTQDRTRSETAFVLPKPPRSPADLIVDGSSSLASRGAEQGLRAVGERVQGLLECQDRFLDELRLALREARVAAGTGEDVGQRLENALGMLEWCEAVQLDLHVEARRARAGQQPTDLEVLCRGLAEEFGRAHPELRLQVLAEAAGQIWAPAGSCERLLGAAVELVAARIGGRGGVALEVGEDGQGPLVRVRGLADPAAEVPPELVAGFRSAADSTGALVAPDEFGPGGSGMVIRFPGAMVPTAVLPD